MAVRHLVDRMYCHGSVSRENGKDRARGPLISAGPDALDQEPLRGWGEPQIVCGWLLGAARIPHCERGASHLK
jgi:hypothetical protein